MTSIPTALLIGGSKAMALDTAKRLAGRGANWILVAQRPRVRTHIACEA